MVLKDWKKVRGIKQDRWEQLKKPYEQIAIVKRFNKYWVVFIYAGSDRIFKTKKQALEYTKQYMRKH